MGTHTERVYDNAAYCSQVDDRRCKEQKGVKGLIHDMDVLY
jgi:hypothetical protein